MEEAAEILQPALGEMIRQAAQGEVLHNDDTRMRVLRLARESSDERTYLRSGSPLSSPLIPMQWWPSWADAYA